jgi:hypothetical protein
MKLDFQVIFFVITKLSSLEAKNILIIIKRSGKEVKTRAGF